ncbi:MAG: PAS domain S-box protein [Ferruginibacter sp.]
MSLLKEKAKIRLSFLLVIIIVVFFLFKLNFNVKVGIEQVKKVNQSLIDLSILGNIFTDIHQLESSQNAYILTGRDIHLFTFNESRDSLEKNIKLLFSNSSSGKFRNNEQELKELLNKKITKASNLISIRKNYGIDSATSLLQKGNEELEMNKLKIKIKFLQDSFNKKIEASNLIRRGLINKVATDFIVFGVLLLLILLLTYFFFLKESKIRKKHEQVLEFNGALISSIKDPVVTISPEFLITNWNIYAEELYGLKEDAVIGKLITEVLCIEIIKSDINTLKENLKLYGVWRGEMIQTSFDNKLIQVSATISNINSKGEKPVGYVALFKDITRQKKMENELIILTNNLEREVERKAAELNSVFDRITDAFMALDNEWNYTYLNKKSEELHGFTEQELKGKNILEIFKDDVNAKFLEALHEARESMQPKKIQLFHKLSNRWFENYIYPSADGVSIYYHDITIKKQAELELITALEKLNSHINNTPLAVVEFNTDMQVVNWSKKAEQIFGWQAEDICNSGFTLFDLVANEDAPLVQNSISDLFQNKENEVLQLKNINQKGEVVYCEWYNSVLKQGNETTGMLALVQDVSERKKIELELQQSETKFKSLVEESLVGVYIIQDQKFSYVNPRFCEIFGYEDCDSVVGKSIDIFLGEDLKSEITGYSKVSLGDKNSLHFEFDSIHKSGKYIKLEVFGSFLKYNNEDSIIGTVVDITEKSETEKKLVKSNERFQFVAKATNDAIWDWDIETDVLSGNERFYYLFGLNNGDKVSFRQFYSKLHPDDMQPIVSNLEEAIAEKKTFVVELFRFKNEDGSFRYINDRAYILYDKDGNAKRMLGAMQDVSEQRIAEQNLLNEKRLSDLIINGLPGIFFVINENCKIYRCNKNLEELLGFTHADNEILNLENFFTENGDSLFI